MIDETLSGGAAAVEESKPVLGTAENPEVTEQPGTGENPENDNADGEIEQVKKKKLGGWQRKLTRLERENAELRAKINPGNPEVTANPDKEPQLNDYATYDEFNKAAIDYKVNQALTERDRKAQEAKNTEEKKKAFNNWQQKVDALIDSDEKYEDFHEVIDKFKNVYVHPAINLVLAESDIGPEIAHYLGHNPELIEELNKKPPYAVAKEMAKIEASLSHKPSAKVSKSPPPITTVKGTATTTVKLDNLDTTSYLVQRHPHLLKSKR